MSWFNMGIIYTNTYFLGIIESYIVQCTKCYMQYQVYHVLKIVFVTAGRSGHISKHYPIKVCCSKMVTKFGHVLFQSYIILARVRQDEKYADDK